MAEGGDNQTSRTHYNPWKALQLLILVGYLAVTFLIKQSPDRELKQLLLFGIVYVVFEIRAFRYDVQHAFFSGK